MDVRNGILDVVFLPLNAPRGKKGQGQKKGQTRRFLPLPAPLPFRGGAEGQRRAEGQLGMFNLKVREC
jgi:hypothetical protein